MFDNIGGKIKGLATVTTVLGIIGSIIVGALLFEEGGVLIIIFGSVGAWLSSFVLYGFGQLVENSDRMVELAEGKNNSRNAGGYGSAPQPYQGGYQPDYQPNYQPNYQPSYQAPYQSGYQDIYQDAPQAPAAKPNWVCANCGLENEGRVAYCVGCNTSKAWSLKQQQR